MNLNQSCMEFVNKVKKSDLKVSKGFPTYNNIHIYSFINKHHIVYLI